MPLGVSTVAAGAVLLSRRFLVGPNPDWWYTNFGPNSLHDLTLVSIRALSDSLRFNGRHLTWKARLLLWSAVSWLTAAAWLA